jgi:hypothetical protein
MKRWNVETEVKTENNAGLHFTLLVKEKGCILQYLMS